jgi:predicted Zn-dependent peptidase
MRRGLFGILLFAVLALLQRGSDATADWPAGFVEHPRLLKFPEPTFVIPAPERIALANGATVYFLEDSRLPQVSVRILARTGALHDPPGKEGLASLTAATLPSGGTAKRSSKEFGETLERLAAEISSKAEKDYMEASLWCLADVFPQAFDMFMTMLRQPAFEEEKVAVEREKILEGIRRVEDNPRNLTRREFVRLVYGSHPYGTPKEGEPESVEGLAAADLKEFHTAHYHPGNMIVAVSGDMKKKTFLRELRRAFRGWESPSGAMPSVRPVSSEDERTGIYYLAKPLTQTSLRMGHLGIRKTDPDYFAVRVMNFILGGGSFSSRLVSRVRAQEGLAYSVGSRYAELRDRGYFFAATQTKVESTKRAVDLMLEEIRRMRKESVSDEELATAKESLMNRLPFVFETSQMAVEAFSDLELYGLPRNYYADYRERIAAVTRDDVLRAAKKHLRPDRMLLLVVGDEEAFDVPLEEWGPVTRLSLEAEAGAPAEP